MRDFTQILHLVRSDQYGHEMYYNLVVVFVDLLEVAEDEEGGGEGGQADGVAGEVDVGQGGRVGGLPQGLLLIRQPGEEEEEEEEK